MNPARRAWLGWLASQAAGAGAGAGVGAGVGAAHGTTAGSVPGSAPGSLQASAAASPPVTGTPPEAGVHRGRRLAFPRDHGAHVDVRTEWWYVTGWLARGGGATPTHGFQITFFRSRLTEADADAATAAARPPGRFAPRQLLFAHAAVTDLAAARHRHAQRIARWNGEPGTGPDRALLHDADIRLARWHLARDGASGTAAIPSLWHTEVRAEGFALRGTLQATQPPLLQGDAGFSRKGPEESQASHYYSLPQLDARLTLELSGERLAARGRAWLDHEWSEELLHPQAVGWDWIGINLLDGGALTAFRLRRADGSPLWAGGSVRGAAAPTRAFEPGEVGFTPQRRWRSAATGATYPVSWDVHTPAGRHTVRALLDAQELDSRASTGSVYWEGLAELLDERGQRIGLGYLEMTGYAAPIRIG